MRAPMLGASDREERRAYICESFRCIADCDQCGVCQMFHGQLPELAFEDYIEGKCEFAEVAARFRR